jgi:GNAT superfamily N-acetyltransferase
MLRERSLAAAADAVHLTAGCLPAELALRAIAAGNSPGRVWADQSTLLLWDQGNQVIYLAAADQQAAAFPTQLTTIFTAARRQRLRWLKLRPLSTAVTAALLQHFAADELIPNDAIGFLHAGTVPAATTLPYGVTVMPIDDALLDQPQLAHYDELLDEINGMWGALAQFRRAGFGVAARRGDALIGWCTAEFVSAGRCGIGIAVHPAEQRRGIATALGTAFLAECRQRAVTPWWETGSRNQASIQTARRLGFAEAAQLPGWLLDISRLSDG